MDPDQLQAKYDAIRTEYHICKRKLDSKCEALLILSKELDQCRSERDQFKLMAEQLRERYQDIKRQINGLNPISSSNSLDPRFYSDMQSQSLARLLCETKEQSKSLQFEVDDLRQKLQDALGDIKLLREQIARQRVGTTDEGINTRHFPAYEREDLVRQLESSREQYLQLERDLQQVLDEKEEQVSERDIYRTKYERLNQELNYILRGDEKRIIDIDALSMENKYLKDRLKQMEEEKTIAMATVSKYKSILERKKNKGILKFGPVGQSRSGGVVISQKQVQQLLENQSGRSASPQAQQDLQALASALLDTVNDKNLAISHQRKTNKILGNRVAELEKKIKTLEVSGLWNIPANLTCLEKLRAECEEVKTMLPRQLSETSQTSPESWQKMDSILSPSHSSSTNPSPSHTANQNAAVSQTDKPPISLEDLDLLPTRDESAKNAKFAEVKVGESLEAACCNGYIPDEDRSQKGSGFSQCDHTSTVNQAVQDISVNTSSPECGAGDATLPDNASTTGSNPDPDDSSYRLYNDDGDETFEEMSDLLESLVDTATSKVLQQTEQASHFQREGTLSPTDPTGLAADVVVETRGWSSPTPSQTMSPTCSSPLLGDSGEQSEDSVLNKVDV